MNRIVTVVQRARAVVRQAGGGALRRNAAHRLGGSTDRGDVPGWVLITIMTAGLVTALWAIAGPQLGQLFSDAIAGVKGP
ncbi:hypothetical protein GCM10023258_34300 [Terrabacter aeriphilus]|uniref:Uncharacterized protein n=1 Tax=Terrabacter aeriphilus TaxID=515662 RepID=A0ABP9JME4_9MICO